MGKSNFVVRGGLDMSNLTKGLTQTQKQLSNFQATTNKTMSKIGTGIKLALGYISIRAIAGFAKESIGLASSLNEIQNVVDVTFGSMAVSVNDWSKTTLQSFGLSELSAKKFSSTMGAMLKSSGISGTALVDMSTKLTGLAGDIASFYNLNAEDAFYKLQAGISGEIEPLRRLGVNLTQANVEAWALSKGMKVSMTTMDFASQAQLRYKYILEATKDAQGDFARTSGSWANQTRLLSEQWKIFQGTMGQGFINVLTPVLKVINYLIAKLQVAAKYFVTFTELITGQKQKATATAKQADAVSEVGDAYQEAGKQAKGALAGFDEVNQLADNSGSGGADAALGVGGATEAGPMPVDFSTNAPEISGKVQAMADRVKEIIGGLSDFMTQHKDIIVSAIAGIGAGFVAFKVMSEFPAIIAGIKAAITAVGAVLAGISLVALAVAAAIALVVAGFIYFYTTNEQFRNTVNGILDKIRDAAVYLWQNVLVPFGTFMAGVFVAAWDKITIAASWLYKNVLIPLGNFLLWMWGNVLVPIGLVLVDVLGVAFQAVADIVESFWLNVLVPLGAFFTDIFGPAVEAISAVFKTLWNVVLKPFSTFMSGVLKGAFTSLTTNIQFLWNNVLKPLVTFLAGAFKTTFESVFKTIGNIINSVKTTIIGVLTFITGVFTGDWGKAWEGVKQVFKGVWDTFSTIVKAPINKIIDMVNYLIGAMNKIHFDLPDWIPGIGGKGFGINISPIPALANGGITNGPMAAFIGDNTGGREVVSPLDDLTDIIASAVSNAMLNVMQFSNQSNNQLSQEAKFYIGTTEFARAIIPAIQQENRRQGNKAILLGV